jgi:endonuclease I
VSVLRNAVLIACVVVAIGCDDPIGPERRGPEARTGGATPPPAIAQAVQTAPNDGGRGPGDPLGSLRDAALRAALRERVRRHTALGYRRARVVLLREIDGVGTSDVECAYTGTKGTKLTARGGEAFPLGFNVEHAWPRSRGASREPSKSDLHHLFLTAEDANNARGNLPFGESRCRADDGAVAATSPPTSADAAVRATAGSDASAPTQTAPFCAFARGGSVVGEDEDGRRVMSVRGPMRGNVARALFYFAVRYDQPIDDREERILRKWHAEDPPDAGERARNDRVERAQGNRNPFVDRPELVARIRDF